MPEASPPPAQPNIKDPVYRTKFLDLPDTIASWAEPWVEMRNAEILDFGCGEATTALGFALRKGAKRVVGVDVVSDPTLCLPYAQQNLEIKTLPENLELHQVIPGTLHNERDRFDLIYAWSVMEHVREDLLDETLAMLHERLRDGGLLFIQISPLFYSSEGSHMCHRVPERWGHLRHQHSEYLAMIQKACVSEAEYQSLVSTYETLNRITAPRLLAAIRQAGFVVEREHYRDEEYDVPPEVAEVYDPRVLRLAEVVILARRLTPCECTNAHVRAEEFEAANIKLMADAEALRTALAVAEARAALAEEHLHTMKMSTTWRLAQPLQRLIGSRPRLGPAIRRWQRR